MSDFVVIISGKGSGCDYSIGCNMIFKKYENTTLHAVKMEILDNWFMDAISLVNLKESYNSDWYNDKEVFDNLKLKLLNVNDINDFKKHSEIDEIFSRFEDDDHAFKNLEILEIKKNLGDEPVKNFLHKYKEIVETRYNELSEKKVREQEMKELKRLQEKYN